MLRPPRIYPQPWASGSHDPRRFLRTRTESIPQRCWGHGLRLQPPDGSPPSQEGAPCGGHEPPSSEPCPEEQPQPRLPPCQTGKGIALTTEPGRKTGRISRPAVGRAAAPPYLVAWAVSTCVLISAFSGLPDSFPIPLAPALQLASFPNSASSTRAPSPNLCPYTASHPESPTGNAVLGGCGPGPLGTFIRSLDPAGQVGAQNLETSEP